MFKNMNMLLAFGRNLGVSGTHCLLICVENMFSANILKCSENKGSLVGECLYMMKCVPAPGHGIILLKVI